MSDNLPLVSIIIPVYNRVELISQTLKSIVAQSYRNWECLVVDDGSNKENKHDIKNLTNSDNRIQFLERPRNRKKGANACRNFGLENSKGEYIVWFDSDDLMHLDYIETFVNWYNHANHNYSICESNWINIKGQLIDGFRSNSIKSNDPINDYIQFAIFWPINAVCYKRSFLIERNLQFDELLNQSQEYDFHVKVLLTDMNYGVVSKKLLTIVTTEDSTSYSDHNIYKKIISSIKVRLRFLDLEDRINITYQTKMHIMNDLFRMFQQQTLQRRLKISLYAGFSYLLAHFKNVDIAKKYFFKHLIPVSIVIFTFNIFGKGYSLFKRGNTFKNAKMN